MKKIIYDEQLNYLKKFRSEKNELLLEMENFAAENKIPILDSNSAILLEQLIQIQRPVRVLELGTAIGYSAIRIARNLSKKGFVHTIEKSDDNIALAENFIARSGLGSKIRLVKGEAADIMPALPKKYDFIFLDADKEDYKRLFDYALVLLKKNGILFIDNLLWHGFTAANRVPREYKKSTKLIREFNEIFLNQAGLKSSILTIGDGIGLAVKIKSEEK